jgi:hypothetical protein
VTRPEQMIERYVGMWNEPDPEVRRAAVRELWADDGAQILKPPQEVLAEAARIGFVNPVLSARGHQELEERVAIAYEEFIAPGSSASGRAETARSSEMS